MVPIAILSEKGSSKPVPNRASVVSVGNDRRTYARTSLRSVRPGNLTDLELTCSHAIGIRATRNRRNEEPRFKDPT